MTAINFPAAPAAGTTHTEAGITWTFDGTAWDATGVGYVSKAGDKMSGDLTVPSLNGGQLAGFRNVLINGDLKINQRGVTIAAAAVGAYGPDRWKKVDAGNMTQIVEDINYIPNTVYTLSGNGVTAQQLTSPASGHWTLPPIPITASNIQLEPGAVATPYEHTSPQLTILRCYRYFRAFDSGYSIPVYFTGTGGMSNAIYRVGELPMRAAPTVANAAQTVTLTQYTTATIQTPYATTIKGAVNKDGTFLAIAWAASCAGLIATINVPLAISLSAEL